MIITLLVYVFAIAGLSVAWKNLQDALDWLAKLLKSLPWVLWKVLTCGYCFTMWLTLAVVLIFDPLKPWAVSNLPYFVHIFGSWMAMGIAAAIIRTNYVMLQAKLHYQMHVLNKGSEH